MGILRGSYKLALARIMAVCQNIMPVLSHWLVLFFIMSTFQLLMLYLPTWSTGAL